MNCIAYWGGCFLAIATLLEALNCQAEDPDPVIVPARPFTSTNVSANKLSLIDLPTALRLAGGQNLVKARRQAANRQARAPRRTAERCVTRRALASHSRRSTGRRPEAS